MMGDFWFSPFGFAFAGVRALFMLIFVAFWIWMIVDVARRSFRNETEKIIWIVIVVLCNWIGALVYFLIIRMNNPRGLSKDEKALSFNGKGRKSKNR